MLSRRRFLQLIAAAGALPLASCTGPRPARVGLALGGGGARGLAHIPMLETFDALGIRLARVAGTSIGALVGALYAGGLPGSEIRSVAQGLVGMGEAQVITGKPPLPWWRLLSADLFEGGLLDTQPLIDFLGRRIGHSRFETLPIPLSVVATDFWRREAVVFESGDLLTAVKASIALPGLFTPVPQGGRILVDGGLVDPVPYELLFRDCDYVIACDVLGTRTADEDPTPGYFEAAFNSMQIMQAALMREKLARRPPHLYLRPDLRDIGLLEFDRAAEIYAQAEPSRAELARSLRVALRL